MIKKTITSVIPTYNRKIYLREAIQSCLNQTIKHEIIVCNHGGTDDTDSMIKEFEGKIKYIKREKNHGPHFCWLDGVMEASGDYINLLFDDDWIRPKFIEECMKLFNNHNIGFVFSAADLLEEPNKKFLAKLYYKPLIDSGIYDVFDYEFYFLKSLISPTAIILKKKDLIDSLYQGSLPLSKSHYKGVGPDKFIILLCLLRYKKFGFISESLSVCRSQPNSITVEANLDKQKKIIFTESYSETVKYYYTLKYGKYFSFLQNKYLIETRYFLNTLLYKLLRLFKSQNIK
jgi:glycosyltransferase involved in cell wall biosynthesis